MDCEPGSHCCSYPSLQRKFCSTLLLKYWFWNGNTEGLLKGYPIWDGLPFIPVFRLKAITVKQIENPPKNIVNGSDRLKLLDKCIIYMTKTWAQCWLSFTSKRNLRQAKVLFKNTQFILVGKCPFAWGTAQARILLSQGWGCSFLDPHLLFLSWQTAWSIEYCWLQRQLSALKKI